MNIELVADLEPATRQFDGVGDRVVDVRPVWPSILDELFELNRRRFDSGGREGGEAWEGDDADTLARKARDHDDPRTLHRSRRLRRAATELGADGQRVRMSPTTLVLSLTDEYAGVVNKRRPIFAPNIPTAVTDSMAHKLLRFIDEGVA